MAEDSGMSFLQAIPRVHATAEALMTEKGRTYGASWKARGGQGAWFTLVRPLDRLERIVGALHGGDIFAAISAEPSGGDGSALDAVRDLRNYLTLVEAEMVARGVVELPEKQTRTEIHVHQSTMRDIPESEIRRIVGAYARNFWDREPEARPSHSSTLDDGQETCHDMGVSREPWYTGLLAWHKKTGRHMGRVLGDLERLLGAHTEGGPDNVRISSRRLDDGSIQLDIRIP